MVNEIKGKESWRAIVPAAVTAEVLSNQLKQVLTRITRLENQGETEVRGISSSKPLQLSRSSDYVERNNPPRATSFSVVDRREGTPGRADFIAATPRGDLPLQGRPVPKTKQIQEILVDSRGKQIRRTITVPSFETPAATPPSSVDTAALYEISNERPAAAAPYESIETVPTRQGVVSLQDSVEGLKRSLDKITGKK